MTPVLQGRRLRWLDTGLSRSLSSLPISDLPAQALSSFAGCCPARSLCLARPFSFPILDTETGPA